MKSGSRSSGLARYTAAATSAILADRGNRGSVTSRPMSRAMSGRAFTRAFTAAMGLLKAFGHHLADVLHAEPLLRAHDLATEVDHRQAERARRAHHRGLGAQDLLDADHVHPFPGRHLHPHVAATTTAAEATLAVAGGL